MIESVRFPSALQMGGLRTTHWVRLLNSCSSLLLSGSGLKARPTRAQQGANRVKHVPRTLSRLSGGARVGFMIGWLLTALLAPAFVGASNFGGPLDVGKACDGNLTSQCVAENYTHSVYNDSSVNGDYLTAMSYAVSYLDVNTDMTVTTVTLSNTNDVRAYKANYGANGAWAWGACQDPPLYVGARAADGHTHGHNWCKPQLLHWNTYYASNFDTLDKKRAIACHELSHTIGLRHSTETGSCMRNPPTTGGSIDKTLTTHDRGQVNVHYP